MWGALKRLVKDPPPEHVFELSEAGIAYAQRGRSAFSQIPAGTIKASPSEDNLLNADTAAGTISTLVPANGAKRRRAAVLLPDAAARISVLDFDSFPDSADEQLSLVRFRVKKTIPFDIDAAAVSYCREPGTNGKGKIEVVAVTIALEVLARYEALFRGAGFHPGDVSISALSALSLYDGREPALIAKLAGGALTVMVAVDGKLKLFRCVALEEGDAGGAAEEDEIMSVLHPTFAYAEDELQAPIRRLIVCGFDYPPRNLPVEPEPLRSVFGTPTPFNAGLLGYLEAAT
jgi:type IV pilus assembly protein PilM